ncbi:TM0106 family RecB-like putative nuclease [Candidatus Pelagibacter sp.]|nr:TM0106 family RecB-like putative nuclease [Candidatus Pelagibacter sp.]
MRVKKNQIFISPSDLNNFVSCKYHAFNDLNEHVKNLKKKDPSEDMKLWRRYGDEHEAKHLKLLKEKYSNNITIDPTKSDEDRFNNTIDAIKKGFDLIYKAYFIEDQFRGEADFLIKTNVKSDLGDYSYEVYDTKVTKNLKPKHVLQITAYSYLISKITGVLPKQMYLIDGKSEYHTYKVHEFLDYFNFTKNKFEDFIKEENKEKLYPENCNHCNYCIWQDECLKIWEGDNYINQVARINKSQITKLKKEGIDTVEKLAKADIEKIKSKINRLSLERLHQQANLQEEKRLSGVSKYVVLDQVEGQGFYKMPKPNDGDLFFDIEGFPESNKRNLEYLHGLYFKDKGKKTFKYFYVKDNTRESEFEIFKDLINFLKKRFDQYPDAYIYHYNDYETRALKELASEYSGVFPEGNNLVDFLLRNQKFVDLYRVVEHTLRTSEKDLSLKSLEKFYRKEREANIKTAADSIRLFDNWCSTKDDKIREDIIHYNEEDCVSTGDLRDFLLDKKPNDIPYFTPKLDDEEDEKKQTKARKNPNKKTVQEVEEEELQLIEKLNKSKKDKAILDNLIDLVGFHRREAKPDNWRYYDRLDKTPELLEDDSECLANCIFKEEIIDKETDQTKYIYQFETQNFKIKEGDSALELFEENNYGKVGEITEDEDDGNFVEIISNNKAKPPEIFTFKPSGSPPTDPIREALNKFLGEYADSKDFRFKCGLDILENNFPDVLNIKKGEKIFDEKKDLIEEAKKTVKNLNSSYLLVQGPPGAGKTYISAHMIVSLIKAGKKVGVTSNSHKAINNLLAQVEEVTDFEFRGFKKNSKKEDKLNGKFIEDVNKIEKEDYDSYLLFAGTAWLFSNEDLNQKLDYLFIDEAGQVSLANTLAMCTSTKNIVLIGDQMQLSQPIKGTHPGIAGKSSLEYLLEGYDTIPPEKGIFLNETRRLNKNICEFISSSFYESRLKPHPVTSERHVKLKLDKIKDEGINFIPMSHENNTQKSIEESEYIKDLMAKIVGKKCKDNAVSKERNLELKDILVVAPFNMQVNNLTRNLPENSKVGTIDKFQGQEAKIVFISMTASDPENIPRHKGFLFSRNRLNVGISRAECVTFILFNPNLLNTSCQKIEEMRLINNFCKLLKYNIN